MSEAKDEVTLVTADGRILADSGKDAEHKPSHLLTAGPLEIMTGLNGEPIPLIEQLPNQALCLDKLRSMQMDPQDFLICAYPKTGTHWIWEVMMMLNQREAKHHPEEKDVCWFDITPLDEIHRKFRSPRILSTHYPLHHFTETFLNGCKVIYLLRNPKDALISNYFHLTIKTEQTLSQYFRCYLYSKYNWWGTYFDNLAGAWDNYRNRSDVLFLFFEDAKQHFRETVKKLADFMNIDASEQLIDEIVKATNFKQLKEAKYDSEAEFRKAYCTTKSMFRKGEIGDWKNHLTVAQNEEFDQFLKEWNKDRQIPFIYE